MRRTWQTSANGYFSWPGKKEAGFDWANKTIALFGTAFKRDTNDIRNSPSIDMVHTWQENNAARIVAYDPAAVSMFSQLFPQARSCSMQREKRTQFRAPMQSLLLAAGTQFRGLADLLWRRNPARSLWTAGGCFSIDTMTCRRLGLILLRSGVRL